MDFLSDDFTSDNLSREETGTNLFEPAQDFESDNYLIEEETKPEISKEELGGDSSSNKISPIDFAEELKIQESTVPDLFGEDHSEEKAHQEIEVSSRPAMDDQSLLDTFEGGDFMSSVSAEAKAEDDAEAEAVQVNEEYDRHDSDGFDFLSDQPISPTERFQESTADTSGVEVGRFQAWRQEFRKALEEKDEKERLQIQDLRIEAKKQIEDWYKQLEDQLMKTKATNREAEQALLSGRTLEACKKWEQVSKLCNFGAKPQQTKDVSRMKSIMLQLKQSTPAI